MDSELSFQWPGAARLTRDVGAPLPIGAVEAMDAMDPLDAMDAMDPVDAMDPIDVVDHGLDEQLHIVEREIRRLEVDRSAARRRIEELEAANGRAQSLITAQRRRLLVLERQLEDAHVVPAFDSPSRTSWLDRLLGGASPARTLA